MGKIEPEPGLKAGQLRTLDVWALGVGIVVCGQYFGWNLGLQGGPVALLIASLIVCLLFLAWVLTLAELAVAMPRADGPLDHGLQAAGPWLGFLMAWSMLLECLFGGIATALAVGEYVAFLVDPQQPDRWVAVAAGLTCVAVFFVLQVRGVREQARALVLMTWAALAVLVVFWVAAATNFSWPRLWPSPELPPDRGWGAVTDAIPYALWWLIIIEGAALAAEEAHLPQRSIPRGLTWAVVTVIGLVVLTIATTCGAAEAGDVAAVHYPLAEVLRRIPAGRRYPLLVSGFSVVALFGLTASYHGLLYGSSRQVFALGRGRHLPAWLGAVHGRRHTPVPALAACSLITAGVVLAYLWYDEAVKLAVLTAGFAALVLYVLSMVCLVVLRRRQSALLSRFRGPLPALLPAVVVGLSALGLVVYPRMAGEVVPVALALYALGAACLLLWPGRRREGANPTLVTCAKEQGRQTGWLDRLAGLALVSTGIALAWVCAADVAGVGVQAVPIRLQVGLIIGLLSLTIALVSALALRSAWAPVEEEV